MSSGNRLLRVVKQKKTVTYQKLGCEVGDGIGRNARKSCSSEFLKLVWRVEKMENSDACGGSCWSSDCRSRATASVSRFLSELSPPHQSLRRDDRFRSEQFETRRHNIEFCFKSDSSNHPRCRKLQKVSFTVACPWHHTTADKAQSRGLCTSCASISLGRRSRVPRR